MSIATVKCWAYRVFWILSRLTINVGKDSWKFEQTKHKKMKRNVCIDQISCDWLNHKIYTISFWWWWWHYFVFKSLSDLVLLVSSFLGILPPYIVCYYRTATQQFNSDANIRHSQWRRLVALHSWYCRRRLPATSMHPRSPGGGGQQWRQCIQRRSNPLIGVGPQSNKRNTRRRWRGFNHHESGERCESTISIAQTFDG